MPKLSTDAPFLHEDCAVDGVRFGAFVEIGKGSRLRAALDDFRHLTADEFLGRYEG